MTATADQGLPARRAALQLLGGVLGRQLTVAEQIQTGALEALDAPARARAQRLALETLRGLERADRLLAKHLRKPPPLAVRNILRLAVAELAGGAAAHGVVNDAVALTAENKRTQGLKGLVNAVLRKVAADLPATWEALRIPRLPKWLRGPLTEAWGPQAIAAIEAAHFAGAPLDLTVKQDPEGWAGRLGGTVLPTGTVRLASAGQVSALPGYDEGAWWVQDAAAALPVRLLGDVTGLEVLDLCAAPGGKTMQLAAGGARVTALDLLPARLERLAENLARTQLSARCEAGDALKWQGGPYDAIVLDAPCSATGTIRRHPDLPHARDGSGIAGLIGLQAQMIDAALALLKPGGRLIFCTCSLLPDEGECQVDEALERHPGLRVLPAQIPGAEAGWASPEGGLRLRPDFWADQGGMDGFYMAVLQKD